MLDGAIVATLIASLGERKGVSSWGFGAYSVESDPPRLDLVCPNGVLDRI